MYPSWRLESYQTHAFDVFCDLLYDPNSKFKLCIKTSQHENEISLMCL